MQKGRMMEYNSLREKLIIPEYGRNFQKLIRHAKTIEDQEERQLYVERIIELIYQMNPQSKNVLEFRERIWKHIFRISDYDLGVTPPDGIIPTPEDELEKPDNIEYPANNRKRRHYGNHVNALFAKAIAMEDEQKKQAFTELIASFMKVAYKNWNREHYVSDEIVKSDLADMTDGKLTLGDDVVLVKVSSPSPRSSVQHRKSKRKQNTKGRPNNNRSRPGRFNGSSNNNRRR